ncbi:hypothetical protein GTY40_04870 [Streptomyces sp. SID8359]|uniref:hypothetical protein n=1 Tax=Streptomyces TaxID=1883 RepID=UPI00048D8EDF|nr:MULTISPECIES: hypothetical protein [unclassified Streptomyces]MYT90386.1 hypothetical protein [Streptomyces sp. SID8359]
MNTTLPLPDVGRPIQNPQHLQQSDMFRVLETEVTVRRVVLSLEEISERLARTETMGCNPRPLNQRHVNRLAEDMGAGRWGMHSAETVSLCAHGCFINGKHRANAAVLAQMPLVCWLAENVPHEEFVHMDGHRQRSYADLVTMAGVEKNATGIASAIRLLGFYDHRRDIPWSMWRGKSYVPRTTFVEWAGQYRDCSGYSSLANRLRQGGHLTWSAGIASSYLLYRQVEQHDAVDAFFNALITGAISKERDPRLLLRNALVRTKGSGRGNEQLAMVLTAWNMWASGRGKSVVPSPTRPAPDISQYAPPRAS